MNLKSLLENHRISQRQFAEKMGISTSAVNSFINYGIYPKKTTQADFNSNINKALTELGVLELYEPTPLPDHHHHNA